ncbi:MAG: hypothetical protein IPJ16_13075 [Bacteroidales bacterium]|nr:hypothetical protein [Bacteroidales bacterium]
MKTKTEYYRPSHTKEPEPYFVNEVTYKLWNEIHQSSLCWLQAIASDYRGLSFGNITAAELSDCLARNLTAIKSRFNRRIDDNIAKIGIDNDYIINNLRAGTSDPLVLFEEKLIKNLEMIDFDRKSFQSLGSYNISVSNYTIKDGNITFTEENKKRIREIYCTTYINSDAQRHFLKLAETTLGNLHTLKAILQKNGVENLFGYGNLFEVTATIPETIYFNKELLKRITKI